MLETHPPIPPTSRDELRYDRIYLLSISISVIYRVIFSWSSSYWIKSLRAPRRILVSRIEFLREEYGNNSWVVAFSMEWNIDSTRRSDDSIYCRCIICSAYQRPVSENLDMNFSKYISPYWVIFWRVRSVMILLYILEFFLTKQFWDDFSSFTILSFRMCDRFLDSITRFSFIVLLSHR